MIKEAFQDLNRLRQIAVIAAKHGFADFLERTDVSKFVSRREAPVPGPSTRRESLALRFRLLLQELGPTFIKLGQVLSTRADLIPAEVVEELSKLQDDVVPMPFVEVKEQIRQALGRNTDEVFQSIDETPVGSASIAQVHKAVLKTGEDVVIKIQRPRVAEQIRADLSVLSYLAKALEATVEEMGIYSPTGIVEEFDRAIHEELDFLNEASNIRAFFKNYQDREFIRIPRVYEEWTTKTVLTMERISGTKLAHAPMEREERHQLALKIIQSSFQQLFEDGLFHGDPHPGNMFLLDGGRIALIDFGLVGRLTKPMQETLIQLVLAVALRDADSTARILYRIGAPGSRTQLLSFKQDIENIFFRYLPSTLGDISAKNLLRDLLDLSVKHHIRLPKEYAILSRASVATEGILRTLAPDLNIAEAALPYAKKLLGDRLDPSKMQDGLMKTLLRLQSVAGELPTQITQIMMDLESGRFSVRIASEELKTLNQNLRHLALIGFLGLCACGLIVGTFLSFATHTQPVGHVPMLGVVGLSALVFLLSSVATWYWFTSAPRKLSLTKLLRKRR